MLAKKKKKCSKAFKLWLKRSFKRLGWAVSASLTFPFSRVAPTHPTSGWIRRVASCGDSGLSSLTSTGNQETFILKPSAHYNRGSFSVSSWKSNSLRFHLLPLLVSGCCLRADADLGATNRPRPLGDLHFLRPCRTSRACTSALL